MAATLTIFGPQLSRLRHTSRFAKVVRSGTESPSCCTHDPAPQDVVTTTTDQSPNAERNYAANDQDPLFRPVAGNEGATQYTINAPDGLNWHRLDNLSGPLTSGSCGHGQQYRLPRVSKGDTEQQGLPSLGLADLEAVAVCHRHDEEGRGGEVRGHFAA